MHSIQRLGAIMILLAASLLVLTACDKKPPEDQKNAPPPPTAEFSQFVVRGKVTHDGKAVPFGYVAFYSMTSLGDSGKSVPPSVSPIGKDGTYEVRNPPKGPNMVCVFTDPEMDVSTVFQAGSLGPPGGGPPNAKGGPPVPPGGGGPPMPPGGGPPMPPGGGPPMPPGGGGPPMPPGGGGPPMPPGGGGPPMPPGGGGPPMPPGGGPPMPPGGGPPVPPGVKLPPAPKAPPMNEVVEKLTDEEKKTLKDLNAKYSKFGKSPLMFAVAGEAAQTYNIELNLGSK